MKMTFKILLISLIFLTGCGSATKQYSKGNISATTQNPAFNKLLYEIDNIRLELEPSDKPYFFYISFKEIDGERLVSILANLLRPWIMHPERFSGYFFHDENYLFFLNDDNDKILQYYRQNIEFNKDATSFPKPPTDYEGIDDSIDNTLPIFYKIDDNDNLIRLEWSEELVLKMREK